MVLKVYDIKKSPQSDLHFAGSFCLVYQAKLTNSKRYILHICDFSRGRLNVMEYDVSYTSKMLMEKLGLHSKEGFRRNYLRPAIKMNLIRMTIPDKPNSRNQRYVRD